MPGDWSHWLFLAVLLAIVLVICWSERRHERRIDRADLSGQADFADYLRALDRAHEATPTGTSRGGASLIGGVMPVRLVKKASDF